MAKKNRLTSRTRPYSGQEIKDYIHREYGEEVHDFAIAEALFQNEKKMQEGMSDSFGGNSLTLGELAELAVGVNSAYLHRRPETGERFLPPDSPIREMALEEVDLAPGEFTRGYGRRLGSQIHPGPITSIALNQGGPVMPGLGFRPLGYELGGTVQSVEHAERIIQQLGRSVGWGEKEVQYMMLQGSPEDKIAAAESILRATPLSGLQEAGPYTTPQRDTFGASTDLGAITGGGLGGVTTSDMLQLPLGGYELTGPTDEVFPSSYLNPQSLGEQRFRENVGGSIYGGENTPVDMTKTWEQLYSPQGGSLIPQFQTGGYADNSRGTVAGELGRRGDMSVREEGETMAELSKRHRERDWYSKDKMGGGLGSLGPLRRDRRRA